MTARGRSNLALAFVVLGGLATAGAAAAVYAHHVLVDPDGFADSVAEAVRQPAVSRELSVRLANGLVDAEPDLVAAERPIESATASLLETGSFEPVVRRAALFMHDEAFAERGTELSLDLADGMQFLASVLAVQDPSLRKEVERVSDAEVVRLETSGWINGVTTIGQVVSELAVILPIVALLLFAAALAISRERGRALGWIGIAIAAAGAVLLLVEVVIRTMLPRQGFAAPDAVEQALGVFVGGLTSVALLLGVAGGAIAAAGTGRVSADRADRALGRTWAFLRRSPERPFLRVARAAMLLVLGVLLLAQPLLAAQIVAIAAGFVILVEGLAEVVAVLGGASAPAPAAGRTVRSRHALVTLVAVALGVAGVAAVLVAALTRIPESDASLGQGCNGSVRLCDRPLDRVALPASHNAMSSAEDGFIDPNNRRSIVEQLDGGIRGLLIDSHVARPTKRRSTALTVLDAEVVASARRELGVKGVRALEDFLARRLERPTAPPRPYFCHIICELGAIQMEQTLTKIKAWMDANPREVVVIVIQDLVSPIETERMFRRTGLYDLAFTWKTGEPAPTLRRMIDANQRLLVMAEVDGFPNGWYQPGYVHLLRETPYDSPTVAALRSRNSCRPNRGNEANPLFLLNHWVAVYPPRLSDAQVVNEASFLRARIARCRAIRGATPNLVAVDFAGTGDVVKVVDALNGVRAP